MKLIDDTKPYAEALDSYRSSRAHDVGDAFRLGVQGLQCKPTFDTQAITAVIGTSAWALKDEYIDGTVQTIGLLGGVPADLGYTVCPIGSDEARAGKPDLVVWVCGDETRSDEEDLLGAINARGITIGSCATGIPGWTTLDVLEPSIEWHRVVDSFATAVGDIGTYRSRSLR